jgi:hypothetical protein
VPAAVLLLALCILASGAQALMVPMDDAALATAMGGTAALTHRR